MYSFNSKKIWKKSTLYKWTYNYRLNKELLENVENEDIYEDLNKSEIKILSIIKNNANCKIRDLAKLTDYSESYINKILRYLKEKKYIKRIGANKNGYWSVCR